MRSKWTRYFTGTYLLLDYLSCCSSLLLFAPLCNCHIGSEILHLTQLNYLHAIQMWAHVRLSQVCPWTAMEQREMSNMSSSYSGCCEGVHRFIEGVLIEFLLQRTVSIRASNLDEGWIRRRNWWISKWNFWMREILIFVHADFRIGIHLTFGCMGGVYCFDELGYLTKSAISLW